MRRNASGTSRRPPARRLSTIDMLPLVRITALLPRAASRIRGAAGILFPRGGDIRALGVLFNTNIFPDRGGQYSESWIYGGAADRDVVHLSEDDLGAVMDRDRQCALRSMRPTRRATGAPLARGASAL